MEFFILIRDEGSYWPPGKLDCLSTKKKTFSADSWQVLNQILGCADTEPPTPVTYDLHYCGLLPCFYHSSVAR